VGKNRYLIADEQLWWQGNLNPIASTDYHPSHDIERVRNIWRDYYYRTKYGDDSGWGYFSITSTRNKLYFKDNGAVARTATITGGEYDADSLCTEIKTQMEAQTSDSFTVTYSNNSNKFTITDNTGTYELTCTSTTNAIWDCIGFSTAADKTGSASYNSDYVRIHTYFAVEFKSGDGSARTVTACALFGLNLTSAYQVLKLQRWTGSSWEDKGDFIYNATVGEAIVFVSSSSSTEWRILGRDWANTDGYIQFGNIIPGYYKELSRGYEYGASDDIEDTSQHQFTKKGYVNVIVGFQKKVRGVEYSLMETDREAIRDVYEAVGKQHPFVFVKDSDDAINTMSFCMFVGKFGDREDDAYFDTITLAWMEMV
jgi:hypothetical protein